MAVSRRARYLIVISLLTLGSSFGIVYASGLPTTIVECGVGNNAMCSLCDLVSLGQQILNFLVFFSLIFATLLFINSGALYLFSAANPANISKAHRIFAHTLVGILFVLTSWLVINTIMSNLYKQPTGWRPWNQILCDQGQATPIPPPIPPRSL